MNPKWKAKWDKKKLFDENGNVALLVSKGDQTNNETGVDALLDGRKWFWALYRQAKRWLSINRQGD